MNWSPPADRDRVVDLVRAVSILMVVLGHWLVSSAYRVDGALTGGEILTLLPGWWPLTWVFQVMPLFFFVGGFAHRRSLQSRRGVPSYPGFVAARVIRLMVPTAVFLAAWVAVSTTLEVAGIDRAEVRTAARAVALPLWFLGVYLLVVAIAPLMARLHERWGGRVIVVLLVGAAVADVIRFGAGRTGVGDINYGLVWLVFHQLGFFHAEGGLGRWAPWLAAGGAVLLVGGVTVGPYAVSMVDFPGTAVPNLDPPTLAVLGLGLAQIGAVTLVRNRLAGWLSRPAPWRAVVGMNRVVLTVFLWHLTALLGVVAVWNPLGLLDPYPGGAAWYALRPVWMASAALMLAPLVWMFAPMEAWSRTRVVRAVASRPGAVAAAVGTAYLAFGVLGFGRVGMEGAGSDLTRLLVGFRVSARLNLAHLLFGSLLVWGSLRPGRARSAVLVGTLVAATVALTGAGLLGNGPVATLHGVTALVLAAGVVGREHPAGPAGYDAGVPDRAHPHTTWG